MIIFWPTGQGAGPGGAGSCDYPDEDDVRDGVEYADGTMTGTLACIEPITISQDTDIKRKTELFLVNKLSGMVPAHTFYPFTGGSSSTDAAEIEPPFTVIYIESAERTHHQESTWIAKGTVQIITHASETTTPAHSTLVRTIYSALCRIDPECQTQIYHFHGIHVEEQKSAQDDALEVHADVFNITVGCGG